MWYGEQTGSSCGVLIIVFVLSEWVTNHILEVPSDFPADSRFVPSQWATALLCNNVSHWLGAYLESALRFRNTQVQCWYKASFEVLGIPIIKIRQSWDCLIFIMGIPLPPFTIMGAFPYWVYPFGCISVKSCCLASVMTQIYVTIYHY